MIANDRPRLKILLFSPPVGLAKDTVKKPAFGIQPLGILHLASALKKWADFDYELKVVDAYTFGCNREDIKSTISSFRPDIVGVTSVTVRIYDATRICSIAKEVNRAILTVTGGVHASSIPSDLINYPDTDIFVIGEGEITFSELCRALYNQTDWHSIAGIAYKRDEKIIINKGREAINDLDTIPFPDLSLLPNLECYNPRPHWGRSGHSAIIISSRGCPYNCLYCSITSNQGRKYRFRSPESIVEEVIGLKKLGVDSVIFRDSTFATNRRRVVDFCNLMIKEKIVLNWNCNVRANELDFELLKLMKSAGCYLIFFGIEQGNNELLWKHKRLTGEQVVNATKWARQAGIDVSGYFMMGMPEENLSTVRETIDFAKALSLNSASFTILTPFPGTEVYEYCRQRGLLLGLGWDKFDTLGRLCWRHPALTEEQLLTMLKRANREFYLRPSIIIDRIKRMRTLKDVTNHIQLALEFLR